MDFTLGNKIQTDKTSLHRFNAEEQNDYTQSSDSEEQVTKGKSKTKT